MPGIVINGLFESNGLSIAYRAFGREDAPLLVVHHGFLDHADSWRPVAERLADTHRVVAVDARGHGDSQWIGAGGAYYFTDYVLDLFGLLHHLDASTCVLVGHSMGASVTSYFAGAFPEKVSALVLVDGIGPPHQPPEDAPKIMKRFVRTTRDRSSRRTPKVMDGLEDAARRMRLADPQLGEERALEMAALGTRPVHGGVVWRFDPLHRARLGTPFVREYAMALWRNVTAPVLHVRGGQSPFAHPADEHAARAACFADFAEVCLEEAGHNIHVHDPDGLVEAIRDFLGR